MKFRTSRFGEIEVPDETIIHLDDGILGFPEERRFVLLDHDADDTPFKWLQSVDNPDLAFVVIDPNELDPDYAFVLEDEDVESLGSDKPEDYIPMVIVNIPREDPIKMTANMRGPVVVNARNLRGRQIVLNDDKHVFDHRVFPHPPEEAEAGAGVAAEAAPGADARA